MGFLLALSCALILYGTLYPFSFSSGLREESIVTLLLESLNGRFGRGEAIANVILFSPFGFFAMQRVLPRVPRPIRLIIIVVAGAAFSFGIECAQSRLPGRIVSIYDIAANTAGALLGSLAGWKNWRGKLSGFRSDDSGFAIFPLLLLGAWLCRRLYPFAPTLDVQNVKDALKPLIFGAFSSMDALWFFIVTMIVCRLVMTITSTGRIRTALIFLPLVVIAVKPFITGGGISQAEILGTLSGIAVWWYILGRLRMNAGILAFLLMALIVVRELSPFVFSANPGHFSFIPFDRFLKAVTYINILQFIEKIFLYGALVWLLVKTVRSLKFSLILSVVLLTGIEIMQMYMPGRVTEITDPLLAVILGVFLYFLDLRDETSAFALR